MPSPHHDMAGNVKAGKCAMGGSSCWVSKYVDAHNAAVRSLWQTVLVSVTTAPARCGAERLTMPPGQLYAYVVVCAVVDLHCVNQHASCSTLQAAMQQQCVALASHRVAANTGQQQQSATTSAPVQHQTCSGTTFWESKYAYKITCLNKLNANGSSRHIQGAWQAS